MKVLAGTFSKMPINYSEFAPDSVDGAWDGGLVRNHKKYEDYSCGLGANLLGWQNSYSLHYAKMQQLGDLLEERLGGVYNSCKILQSGSDAAEGAVRYARAYTGRKITLWTGYHGTGNTFISCEKPGLGTVNAKSIKFEDFSRLIQGIREYTYKIAAVIIEPCQLVWPGHGTRELAQLRAIRKLCTDYGIILIFDEIITGGRVLNFTVAEHTGVHPDLLLLGKALGNGYPISAILGKSKYMDEKVFLSNTHNANASAVDEAIRMVKHSTDHRLEKLWKIGGRFFERINKTIRDAGVLTTGLVGYNTRAEWVYQSQVGLYYMTKIWDYMASKGIILGRAHFINYKHTSAAMDRYIKTLKEALDSAPLDGRPPHSIFKRN